MSLAQTFAATAAERVERAAAAVARGDQPAPVDLVGVDLEAVDARVLELAQVAELQAAARDVDRLRAEAARLTSLYAEARDAARSKAIAGRGQVVVVPADPRQMRAASAAAQAADAALARLLRLLPEPVAAGYLEAQRGLDAARAEVERATRRLETVPAERSRLEQQRRLIADDRHATHDQRARDLARIDAQLAELPSDADLTRALKTTTKALPKLEAARSKALAAALDWRP